MCTRHRPRPFQFLTFTMLGLLVAALLTLGGSSTEKTYDFPGGEDMNIGVNADDVRRLREGGD